jgi:hypothetical protein
MHWCMEIPFRRYIEGSMYAVSRRSAPARNSVFTRSTAVSLVSRGSHLQTRPSLEYWGSLLRHTRVKGRQPRSSSGSRHVACRQGFPLARQVQSLAPRPKPKRPASSALHSSAAFPARREASVGAPLEGLRGHVAAPCVLSGGKHPNPPRRQAGRATTSRRDGPRRRLASR